MGGGCGVPGAGPTAGLLLHREAVRLAAGDFEAAQLFKYQLCSQDTKTKERSGQRSEPEWWRLTRGAQFGLFSH